MNSRNNLKLLCQWCCLTLWKLMKEIQRHRLVSKASRWLSSSLLSNIRHCQSYQRKGEKYLSNTFYLKFFSLETWERVGIQHRGNIFILKTYIFSVLCRQKSYEWLFSKSWSFDFQCIQLLLAAKLLAALRWNGAAPANVLRQGLLQRLKAEDFCWCDGINF